MEITIIIRGASSLDEVRKAFAEKPVRVEVRQDEKQLVFPWCEEERQENVQEEEEEEVGGSAGVRHGRGGRKRTPGVISAQCICRSTGYSQRQTSKMARTLGIENIGTKNNPRYAEKDGDLIVAELNKLQKKD